MSHVSGEPVSGPPVLRVQALTLLACAVLSGLFVLSTLWLKARHAGGLAYIVAALCFGAALMAVMSFAVRFGCATTSEAKRRYNRRVMASMSGYVVALVGVIGAFRGFRDWRPAGALAYALAVLPALPVVACIAAMGLYLREETDEFERAVLIQSALWATGGALALANVWGFLEMFRLVPQVESWAFFPVWGALLGPAQALIRRRYR